MNEAMKIIEALQAKIYSKDTVTAISNESISDFQRGVIQGKIEQLSITMRELEKAQRNGKN